MRMLRRPLPRSLTPLQVVRAMEHVDIIDAVEAWIATMPAPVQREWNKATEIYTDDPLIDMAREALGKPPSFTDDFLRLAAGLMTLAEFSARNPSNS